MKYVALLRGIGPGDPRMRNENLRKVFESIGLEDVQSVISSGNLVFSADRAAGLEKKIETALFDQLGFHSTTIIRSHGDLKHLIDQKPFGDKLHSNASYLLVTFLKHKSETLPLNLPFESPDGSYTILSYDATARALFTVTDNTAVKTPNVMAVLEKQFGKDITSRTWKTIQRISTRLS